MVREESAVVSGTVNAVVFRNAENGYTVLRLGLGGGDVTCVGCIPGVNVGEGLTVTGTWQSHASYGRQIKVETAQRSLPEGADNIYRYLASGVIKGVGAKTAQLIVQEFGTASLRIIEESPLELTKIKTITEKKALDINRRFLQETGLRRLMDYLVSFGVPPFAAARLYRVYGEEAKAAVMENPYILTDDYFGLDFYQADDLAIKLGMEGDSPQRAEAAVLFELRHNLTNGHVFIPADKLAAVAAQLINVDPGLTEAAVSDLEDGDYIVRQTVAGADACYLDYIYADEVFTANRLLELAATRVPKTRGQDRLIERAAAGCGVEFAPVQRQAIALACENAVMVLTGGPGTGKTTTVRGILALFELMGLETLLAAPTGIAAKRLSELTGRPAQTVHRLLGAGRPEEGQETAFSKDEADPLDCDALILDETSMVDISLMAALLRALPVGARLILVGDADQLPSVGPGNVFGDIIRSEKVPVVRLTEIFRQAASSEIVKNAHRINQGLMPEAENRRGDYFFLRRQGRAIADTAVELITKRLPENMSIPSDEIQVISPTRKTAAGTGDLNAAIQAALNPQDGTKPEKSLMDRVLRVGDRVMQTRNNYDMAWFKRNEAGEFVEAGGGIYNGDTGYIEAIDERKEQAVVRFEDRYVPYPFELLGDLELAYAVTVHKSQGSEYRAVILALPEGMPMLKTRSVLYTAFTRARELLVVVGDSEDLAEMVQNDKRQRRYSGLRARLCGQVQ